MEMKVRSWARLHDVAWAEEAEEREKEGRVQGRGKERAYACMCVYFNKLMKIRITI